MCAHTHLFLCAAQNGWTHTHYVRKESRWKGRMHLVSATSYTTSSNQTKTLRYSPTHKISDNISTEIPNNEDLVGLTIQFIP